MRTLLFTAALALIAGACSPIRDTQGFIAEPDLYKEVKPGVDNRASVAKTLGRPSIQGQWDDKEWFYVSRKVRQFAFRDPKPYEQSIFVVTFDAKGNVTKTETRGMEKIASIVPEHDKTKTLGRDKSFFEELFGNIGQVGTLGAPAGDNQGP